MTYPTPNCLCSTQRQARVRTASSIDVLDSGGAPRAAPEGGRPRGAGLPPFPSAMWHRKHSTNCSSAPGYQRAWQRGHSIGSAHGSSFAPHALQVLRFSSMLPAAAAPQARHHQTVLPCSSISAGRRGPAGESLAPGAVARVRRDSRRRLNQVPMRISRDAPRILRGAVAPTKRARERPGSPWTIGAARPNPQPRWRPPRRGGSPGGGPVAPAARRSPRAPGRARWRRRRIAGRGRCPAAPPRRLRRRTGRGTGGSARRPSRWRRPARPGPTGGAPGGRGRGAPGAHRPAARGRRSRGTGQGAPRPPRAAWRATP